MAQTYKMKHNVQGTIYSLLTVESDGAMTMTFHGTDREICHEATQTEDGWITTGGSLFPGLESGKWNMMEDGRCMMDDVVETTDNTDDTDNHAEPEVIEENTTFAIKREQGDTCINHAEREQSQDCESSVNCTNYTNNEPFARPEGTLANARTLNQAKPKRQRKPRKPRAERQASITVNHEPLTVNHQPSSTMKAVGMVAAATVALLVIYETGLLIPLGLIGLATSGLLK